MSQVVCVVRVGVKGANCAAAGVNFGLFLGQTRKLSKHPQNVQKKQKHTDFEQHQTSIAIMSSAVTRDSSSGGGGGGSPAHGGGGSSSSSSSSSDEAERDPLLAGSDYMSESEMSVSELDSGLDSLTSDDDEFDNYSLDSYTREEAEAEMEGGRGRRMSTLDDENMTPRRLRALEHGRHARTLRHQKCTTNTPRLPCLHACTHTHMVD